MKLILQKHCKKLSNLSLFFDLLYDHCKGNRNYMFLFPDMQLGGDLEADCAGSLQYDNRRHGDAGESHGLEEHLLQVLLQNRT